VAMPPGPLANVRLDGCKHVLDVSSNKMVFEVTSPHSLTQAAGYLKYILGPQKQSVFFRGQTRLFETLSPSAFRNIRSQKAQEKKITALRNACGTLTKANAMFDQIPFEAHEPLLQHYGLRTSWLDAVDNIWIALWFACHNALVSGKASQFLHFEIRDPFKDPNPFSYILLVKTDNQPPKHFVPGLYTGPKTELVDLRVAAPSIFLRPHAQHGVLFRMRGDRFRRPVDYSPQIADVIRMDLRDALACLGNGRMLDTHSLFPPPFYDRGYSFLLESTFPGTREIGGIHHIGT
jgi:hypothetical protein